MFLCETLRDNLGFSGIPEKTNGENPESVVQNIIKKTYIHENIEFERVHRA